VKKITTFVNLSLLLTCCASPFALAVERYISDIVYVPLHSDKSSRSNVLNKGLVSGTKVDLIREELGADNNLWSLVTTGDGLQGWIRSQNLSEGPTAALRLANIASASRNALALQEENKALQQKLNNVQQQYQQLLTDTEDMRQAATTAVNLQDDNKRIHTEYQLLQTRVDVLTAENDQLRKNDNYSQWLYGGGLILGGIIISFILQGLGRRKRKSEWR